MKTTSANVMDAFNQWANRPADERFETLEALNQFVTGRRIRSRSSEVHTRDIVATFDAGTGLRINGAIESSSPSNWSFGQLSTWIGAPAAFMRDKLSDRPDLLTENLNHCIRKAGDQDLKWLLIEPDNDTDPATLQAVTSPTYGRIWDADVVGAVQRLREASGGKWHNPPAYARAGVLGGATVGGGLYASDRDVFAFMIDGGSFLEGGDGQSLNRGFIVTNSEVGRSTFTLKTFLHRGVCGNNIIWGAQNVVELAIRHSKGGPARFDAEALPALMEYANKSVADEEAAFKKCNQFILPAKKEDLQKLVTRAAKFSNRELDAAVNVAKAEEGECTTLWHLVQGFTAHARSFEFIDARTDLETRAGKLIDLAQAVALN